MVLHVHDKLHLDRIPRRYTVEAGKALADDWLLQADEGRYDLWVYGPNGFVREFRGSQRARLGAAPEIKLRYNTGDSALRVIVANSGTEKAILVVQANAYRSDGPWSVHVPAGGRISREWSVAASHCWYDFTVRNEDLEWRFAGRIEDGRPGFSDPAI